MRGASVCTSCVARRCAHDPAPVRRRDAGRPRRLLRRPKVALEQIVGAVRLDDRPLVVSGGVQGVQGDQATALDILQQVSPPSSLQRERVTWLTSVTVSKWVSSFVWRLTPRMRLVRRERRDALAEHRRKASGSVSVDRSSSPMAPPSGPRSGCAKHPAHAGREPFRRRPTQPRHRARAQMASTVSSLCFLPWPRRQSGSAANNSRSVWREYAPASRDNHSGRRVRQTCPVRKWAEHLLGHLVRVRVGAVVARSPWCGPPAASSRRRRHRRGNATGPRRSRPTPTVPMRRLPVRAQAPQAAPQHPRGQVPGPRRYRQDQKPRVVADQVQAPELHRPVPAQPAIPRCALERSRLPAQQRQPVPAPHRDVTQPAARELPKPQVVVPRHEIVPSSALVRARQPHFHLAHDQLSLVESICHAPLYTNRHRKASPRWPS